MRLFGLLLILVSLLLAGLLRPPERPAPGPGAESVPSGLWTAPGPSSPDPAGVSLIAQRPLFEPQRRPPAPERIEEPVPDAPRVRLSAVSVSSDVRIAVVEELDSGRTRRVREGERLSAWTIERVHPDQIVLRWKDRQTTIPLLSGE
jgi:hypothetical protein